MKRLIAVLALVFGAPVVAAAHPEPMHAASSASDDLDQPSTNRFGVGFFYQDVVALTPGTGSFIAPIEGAVFGVAGTLQRRLTPDGGWYLDVGGGYGSGDETVIVHVPVTFRTKHSFTIAYGRAGLGYEVRLHPKFSAHAGGGLLFSRTRATFHNGGSTTEGETLDVFGFDHALGARIALGTSVDLYGEHHASYGWGSGEGPDAKYSASVKTGGFRGGLMFGF